MSNEKEIPTAILDPMDDYLTYIKVERGLSKNSIISYKQDIQAFSQFIVEQGLTSLKQVDRYVILNYLQIEDQAHKARNTVIHSVSSLRKYFLFLTRDRYVDENPMLKIDSPKRARHLLFQMSANHWEFVIVPYSKSCTQLACESVKWLI